MQKKRERLDRVIAASRERMQEEVSTLLGKPFTLSEPETDLVTKEDFFADGGPKSVLAHVDLEGEIEGQGCLLVPVRDAIRIGGTLILLPESELETVIKEEEYTEELEDSYGEIANIICGSLTSTFEEQYPKNFRLVRTEQEVILPIKVDPEAEEPVPPGTYYQMQCGMTLDGEEMGHLTLLLPAVPFGLVEETAPAGQADADASGPAVIERPEGEATEEQVGTIDRTEAAHNQGKAAAIDHPQTEADSGSPAEGAVSPSGSESASATSAPPKKDLAKIRERIDALLESCLAKIGEEIGVLLGGTLKVEAGGNQVCSKEDFIDQAGGKQVMARMEVRGDAEGESYLFLSLRDAIFLGGSLIMLPDSELEEVVRNEEFGADVEDAYGEIANIIAGVYTAVFEEQYRKHLGFVKTGLEVVTPVKIDPDSDEVFPARYYYLQVGDLTYGDHKLGQLQAIFPLELFDLEGLVPAPEAEEPQQPAPAQAETTAAATEAARAGTTPAAPLTDQGGEGWDVLIFTDHDQEASSIASLLENFGYRARILHYRDQIGAHLTPRIQIVFLVMREVNEQGFGMAIKLSSHGLRVPLVAAGPAWTRTAVLRAVKYGAEDILITPASEEDIREKLENNLVKKAA